MPFEADIRKPCDFTVNINYIRTIFEESEHFEDIQLSDDDFRVVAHNIEAEVWINLIRGEKFSLPDICFTELLAFVARSQIV